MPETPQNPAPPPAASAPPTPPGTAELFELSLHALIRPRASFAAAAARPAPSFTASTSLALLYGAAAIGINLVHTAIANPHFLERFSAPTIGVMSAAALGVYTSLWLVAAVGLYAVARLFGGVGEFDRGMQGATALGVVAPILAVCNPLPYGCWLAPALLFGWLAAGAFEGLFAASAAPSRVLGGLLAAAGLAGLAGARALSERAPQIESAALLATQAAQVDTQLANAIQAVPVPVPVPASGGAPSSPAPMPASGLDLLRAPDDGGSTDAAAPAPGSVAAQSAQGAVALQQAQGLRNATVGMLDAFTPILNDPKTTGRMNAAQKKQFAQLSKMITDLRAQLASNKPLSDDEVRRQMAEVQKTAVSFMMAQAVSNQAPAAAPAPAPRLKPTTENANP